ncbi:MAG: NAD(P)H-dependent oxidoreductase [Pseudomonadota bacterium]
MTHTLLRIDASARRSGSVSRQLTDDIVARFGAPNVITRDLLDTPVPQIDEDWVNANFTPADARTSAQAETLAFSDTLVGELQAADTIVIGLPIYNFGVPAALKAWVDQVARAGMTFRYSETGPVGLLEGKRAIVIIASGGTEAGSEIDFATGYLRHVLSFIGIRDVDFVTADRLMIDAEGTMKAANDQVAALTIAA